MFWHANTGRRSDKPARPRQRPTRLRLECLEDRRLLCNLGPGSLDETFGIGGKVTTDFGSNDDVARALVIQSDARSVVAGSTFKDQGTSRAHREMALVRYNTNGGLDNSFGTGGKVSVSWGTKSHAEARGVLLQSDGKLVAAGYVCQVWIGLENYCKLRSSDFAVERHMPDGALDKSFGSGGKVTTDFSTAGDPSTDRIQAAVLQPDGKIVVAGLALSTLQGGDIALARYNPSGSLDATFGSGGKVRTELAGGTLVGNGADVLSLALLPDGKILAAGNVAVQVCVAGVCEDHRGTALLRFNPDGSWDTTFGNGGNVVIDGINASGVRIQSDGKIVTAGATVTVGSQESKIAVARYNSDGALDSTFGSGGLVSTDVGVGSDWASGLVIQPSDGKIVVVGGAGDPFGGPQDFAVVRYNPDGTLDPAFGTGGIVTTNILGAEQATAVELQSDGMIVAAGISSNMVGPFGPTNDFAIARYCP